jgi:hypothetical protein
MTADALPFFLDFGGGGGGTDADSVDSTFVRFVRRFEEDSVASTDAGCSKLASRATAFRFLDAAVGWEGVGALGDCWLAVELDEPAESLAAERVTLGDMRM